MTTQDSSYTRTMQLALAEVHPLRERHTRLAVDANQGPRSPAPVDLRKGVGELGWIFALQRWANASDHALAWGYLLIEAEVQPMAAHLTLLRAVLEGATMVRWLIDPSDAATARCLRGVAVQLEDHRERERFERLGVTGKPPATGRARTGSRRLAILERLIRRHDLPLPKVPGSTELCRRYAVIPDPWNVNGEGLYRLVSAQAHGLPWSVMSGEHGARVPTPGVTGAASVSVTAEPELAARATRAAMATLRVALEELERQAGAP